MFSFMSLILYSREDGIRAGNEILELIKLLNPELGIVCDSFVEGGKLDQIFAEIRRRTPGYGEHCACLEGLLSRLLKPKELHSDIITIWGADTFWEEQANWAPVCEIDSRLGFIQFAHWTGQTDGEAWVYDSEYGVIGNLSAGLLAYDADSLRASFETKFHSPWQIASFLWCSARERRWVKFKYPNCKPMKRS